MEVKAVAVDGLEDGKTDDSACSFWLFPASMRGLCQERDEEKRGTLRAKARRD